MRTALYVPFFSGVLVTAYAVAALFFLRFWRDTRDRLFGYFAVAFAILSAQQVIVAIAVPAVAIYGLRLAAFVLILWAIIDKNRSREPTSG